jgi:acetoin utilization deacetylase AcuC-like enzyme
MGFCIINNTAVTAQYLLDKHRLSRILVVDFDAHHGNGQQEIFYGSNQVLTLSIHQDSIYPFSGKVTELGQGDGLGYNINIPVYGQYGDLEYKHLFGRIVQAIAEQYAPQIILVSAGFDGHAEDTISGLQLSTQGYAELGEILKYLANLLCDDRLLYILEGDYHLPALEESVVASLNTLIEPCRGKPRYGFSQKTQTHIDTSLRDAIGEKWQLL